MKNFITIFLFLSTVSYLNAQTFEIYFAGTGEAAVVDSVIIENLNQAISVTLKGSDILKLGTSTGIYDITPGVNALQIYPNPFTDQAEIHFFVNNHGNVKVAVYDLSGRSVLQSTQFLNPGVHTYRVAGLNQGMYLVCISTQNACYSARLVSRNSLNTEAILTYISSDIMAYNPSPVSEKQLKSAATSIPMPFDNGDRLKLTGMSGNYSTVLTGVPAGDTTITFGFIDCTDADNNHYPVVTIGTQIWMAANLETTRYNDNSPIPLAADSADWALLPTPAYCWFNNDSVANKDIYGALYNWFTVDAASNGGKNVCPSGWHVPSDVEWTVLANYLGGESVAGGKLKETGTSHWNSPNTSATNETGFTVPGTGWRYGNGVFNDIGVYNCLWSTTKHNDEQAYFRELDYNQSYFLKYPYYKRCGFSIRCVKD